MLRAEQLFTFDRRAADSPLVEHVWRTVSEPADEFISIAERHWEIVVTRQEGVTYLTVRGPETRATTAPIPKQAEFFGIQFRLGSFMPNLPPADLVDGGLTLPEAGSRSFWLRGSAWEYPSFDNADMFVGRLIGEGLLVCDPLVHAALNGELLEVSPRSIQRRVRRATGLTQGTLRQIERAGQALELLDKGVPILETVGRAGYADQAHLTRSLRRFVGQTPAQIAVAFVQDVANTTW